MCWLDVDRRKGWQLYYCHEIATAGIAYLKDVIASRRYGYLCKKAASHRLDLLRKRAAKIEQRRQTTREARAKKQSLQSVAKQSVAIQQAILSLHSVATEPARPQVNMTIIAVNTLPHVREERATYAERLAYVADRFLSVGARRRDNEV